MINSMRACVACNYLWSWPISSKSFSHDFAIKLLKYGTSCHVNSTASTVLDGFFPYLTQMITNMKGCVIHNDLWPWPISSRAFSHDFVIKLLKYGATCSVHSTICTVLYGFFPYLALMITSMRRCVMQWPLTWTYILGWVGLWGFLWWAPSAKGKDHHGVSSGWSSVWHRSNTGLSSTQYEQIPIILGIWPFWLTPFFFRSITFWRAYG